MQRSTTVTSGPRSTSRVTGSGPAKAARIGASSRPSSPSRMPSALAWMPMRCSAETPLGERVLDPHLAVEHDARRRRRGAGRRCRLSSWSKGNSPAGDHPGEPVEDLDVGALELAGLAPEGGRGLLGEHGDGAPSWRTGMPSTRTRSFNGRTTQLALEQLAVGVAPGRRRRARSAGEHAADPVAAVDGLGGGRPDLGEHDELVVLAVDSARGRRGRRTAAGRRS